MEVKAIYDVKLYEFDNEKKMGAFWVSCEAGTYSRTLGVGAQRRCQRDRRLLLAA